MLGGTRQLCRYLGSCSLCHHELSRAKGADEKEEVKEEKNVELPKTYELGRVEPALR